MRGHHDICANHVCGVPHSGAECSQALHEFVEASDRGEHNHCHQPHTEKPPARMAISETPFLMPKQLIKRAWRQWKKHTIRKVDVDDVEELFKEDWAQKPLSLRVEECANGATTEGGEVAAPAQVEAELPRRTPVMQPATVIACRCGRLRPFDPEDAPGWVLMLGHTWEWRCPTCPRGGHGLLADRESPPRTPRRTPSAITPRFLTDLSQILDRQRKQYNTTEGGEVAAPTRVEADEHALHLQALHGHVMDHKQIAEAAEAWREAEATAGQQEAPAESWQGGFGGDDWVTTDAEGTKQKRVEKKEKLRVEKAQKAAEIAAKDKELQELQDALGEAVSQVTSEVTASRHAVQRRKREEKRQKEEREAAIDKDIKKQERLEKKEEEKKNIEKEVADRKLKEEAQAVKEDKDKRDILEVIKLERSTTKLLTMKKLHHRAGGTAGQWTDIVQQQKLLLDADIVSMSTAELQQLWKKQSSAEVSAELTARREATDSFEKAL